MLSFLELGVVHHSVRHKRVSQFSATFARRQKRQCYVALIICVVWTHLRSENFEFSLRSEPNHPFDTLEHKLLYAVVDLENIMNEGKNSKNSAPRQHPARKVEAPARYPSKVNPNRVLGKDIEVQRSFLSPSSGNRFQRYSYQPPSMLTDLPPTGLALEVTPIPQEHFRFRNYNELLANSNTQLPVSVTLHKEKTGLMATIQNVNDVPVSLRMFDAQAVSFHIHLARFKVMCPCR
ncbi:hypothetical protein F2Q70_00004259 [Brassica cretica]|uniref:Uncharacterized protein n=1 Tax=Brassica cretica TaxID=69181 RepID=A0A8S9IQ33_BRACR|nr:hypothetical protein F2Q68_00021179 [Brassica cretica]KAF2572049.1 hypothetical protein F2Q70_00004259 [Brassica cretica]